MSIFRTKNIYIYIIHRLLFDRKNIHSTIGNTVCIYGVYVVVVSVCIFKTSINFENSNGT